MPLTERQKRHLRTLAHRMKPVVLVGGGGITDGLINEVDLSLEHHELMKIRVHAEERETRDRMIQEICARTSAELVQRIGHVAVLYRPATKPRITLP